MDDMDNVQCSHHLTVQDRSVFIKWKPQKKQSVHRISKLGDIGGSFEVHCQHSSIDECIIRKQIEYIILEEIRDKKNK